jgi:uncharacterized protein DUF5670
MQRQMVRRFTMLLAIAIILALAWLFGFVVFHVASGAIHVLLVLAVIGLIIHFVRMAGSRGGTPLTR